MNDPTADATSFQERSILQQGYEGFTNAELKQLQWGLRFTPAACVSLTLIAVGLELWPLAMVVSFLGIWAFFFPAAHLMDLIYNHGVRHLFGAVKLPPNPLPRRMACLSAGALNAMISGFLYADIVTGAWIVAGILVPLQVLVIASHFCLLSWMYELGLRATGRWKMPLEKSRAMSLYSQGALVLDVRSPVEFADGHIEGAINTPLETIEEYFDTVKGNICLIYCASGIRSQIASEKLRKGGIKRASNLGSRSRAQSIIDSAIAAAG